jgi:hypothetical protein
MIFNFAMAFISGWHFQFVSIEFSKANSNQAPSLSSKPS